VKAQGVTVTAAGGWRRASAAVLFPLSAFRPAARLRACLVLLLGLGLLTFWPHQATPARADLTTGLAAYDAGDYQTALAQFRGLAEAGNQEAQVALADMLLQGLGGPADSAQALFWYRRAACRGNRIARLNLGELYAGSRGVRRDLPQAYFWLELAAREGSQWAVQRVARLVQDWPDELDRRTKRDTAEEVEAALRGELTQFC
jgi:TPR repeat protein